LRFPRTAVAATVAAATAAAASDALGLGGGGHGDALGLGAPLLFPHANDPVHRLPGKIGVRNLSHLEGDGPLNAALTKPCRFRMACVGRSDHRAEHLTAWAR
jgi:hypothetical protein